MTKLFLHLTSTLNHKSWWGDGFASALGAAAGFGQFGPVLKNKLTIQTGRGIDHERSSLVTGQRFHNVREM